MRRFRGDAFRAAPACYKQPRVSFFSNLGQELAARRRRLRATLGDRGQSLFEFSLLSAFMLGSLGLFIRDWMPAAAPWGVAAPFVFAIGYGLLDVRRQAAPEKAGHDLIALGWTLFCAAIALAAFIIALLSAPPPAAPVDPGWTPPDDAVAIELSP